MSVSYGFYNSLNGDRKYDAIQLSSMFDGLILDGVFASIGTCFVATATDSLTVNIGIGKAWFNNTWIYNDSILPITVPASDLIYSRIDAIVIEIDSSEEVRANSIKCITGTPTSLIPVEPTMASTEYVHQYPICYIYRTAGSTTVTQSNITNKIGTESTPFVTGLLQTINLDDLLISWEDQLDQFVESNQTDFTTWFNQMKDQLTTDAAGNLQTQINSLSNTVSSNPNLLTNWDFRNPVNLNGQTSYPVTGYSLDQWFISAYLDTLTVSVASGCIRLQKSSAAYSPAFIQQINNSTLVGRTATITIRYRGSFNLNDVTLLVSGAEPLPLPAPTSTTDFQTSTLTYTIATGTYGSWSNAIFAGLQCPAVMPTSSYIEIESIKLELGEASTLEYDKPVDWNNEYSKCISMQRDVELFNATEVVLSSTGSVITLKDYLSKYSQIIVSVTRTTGYNDPGSVAIGFVGQTAFFSANMSLSEEIVAHFILSNNRLYQIKADNVKLQIPVSIGSPMNQLVMYAGSNGNGRQHTIKIHGQI